MSKASPNDSSHTKITIGHFKYTEPKRTGILQQDRKYYIKLTIDDQVRKTSISGRTNTPAWDDMLHFHVCDSSKLILEVFAHHTTWSDKLVGRMDERIDSLVSQQAIFCEMDTGTSKRPLPVIAFTVLRSTDPSAAPEVQHAKDSVAELNDIPFQALLSKADTFVNLVAGLFEVDPYTRAAWSALVVASKVVQDQMNRDEKVKQLLLSLDDLLGFLLEAEALKSFCLDSTGASNLTRSQINNLGQISLQITECAYFISEYAKDVDTVSRTAKHLFSNVDNQIRKYQEKFRDFKSTFQEYGSLVTQLTVLQTRFIAQQTADSVQDIASEIDLNEMLYAEGASCIPEKKCLPGTRQGIIDEIVDWANQPTDDKSAQLLWLSGVAGSGKSAIAHSVAYYFKALKRLGSSFCFDAANQAAQQPHYLFSTISRDLAGCDTLWKQALWDVIKDDQPMRKTHSMQYQFENFLVQPAQRLKMIGPTVIVIDALDECENSVSRERLLAILGTQLSALPRNFRIIVTARPEADISEALQDKPYIQFRDMSSVTLSQTKNDISAFIHNKLDRKTRLHLTQNQHNWCDTLVEQSEGLFQWASTACRFIKQPGPLPYEQFQVLCEDSYTGSQLDNLYHKILEKTFPNPSSVTMKRFKTVMGVLLTVKKPLPRATLGFLCFGVTAEAVVSILEPLAALLNGVTSDSTPIHTLHTSFRDFLMQSHSGIFHIDFGEAHQCLAIACFDIMKMGLHFNICQLETSCIFNANIPKLEDKIQKYIPIHLHYACMFWADHLEHSQPNETLKIECKVWMERQFLYWLEVLSLTGVVDTATSSLEHLAQWIVNNDKETAVMAREGQRFVANFISVIKRSTPHIYISALPFAPEKSPLVKHYLKDFPNIIHVTGGKEKNWSLLRNVSEGHKNSVMAVAYSPDSQHIASASGDKTIRVWDAATGDAVGEPLKGHTDWVAALAYSSNGKHIASGSYDNTIRVWDIVSGHEIHEPLKGHMNWVKAVAYSPDGKHIVSGSLDHTVRVWDAATGHLEYEPWKGHSDSVTVVVYSPDGKYIASGSDDNTIRIWNAATGNTVGEPLNMHRSPIRAVAYSPDSSHIVSGSDDKTIRMWNASTGHVIGDPWKGHTDGVTSVAFSPDGQYVVSGSWDKSIRIWNVATGQAVGEPLNGHMRSVMAVAYSANGGHIASGSNDETIRVWDVVAKEHTVVGMADIGHSPDMQTTRHSNPSHGCTDLLSQPPFVQITTPLPFSPSSFTLKGGWAVSNDKILFWVPFYLHNGLYSPTNTLVIGQNSTHIDYSHFVFDTFWTQCKITC
ncbi:hypothetical protein BDZ94DRAFT_1323097 [Collybia nuda]|uniref:C2 domain-containing protein n=1 Tax=Collybia nuda TaxID=64659 RepID=A0A9P5Y5X4_9AGAR|nr:hypothetical protein BDZ94DRAFT_1323097 [Collybia nuda]